MVWTKKNTAKHQKAWIKKQDKDQKPRQMVSTSCTWAGLYVGYSDEVMNYEDLAPLLAQVKSQVDSPIYSVLFIAGDGSCSFRPFSLLAFSEDSFCLWKDMNKQ